MLSSDSFSLFGSFRSPIKHYIMMQSEDITVLNIPEKSRMAIELEIFREVTSPSIFSDLGNISLMVENKLSAASAY